MSYTRWLTVCFRRSGSTEEKRPLVSKEKKETDSNPQTKNYHAVEITLTEDQLVKEVEKSMTKKIYLTQHPPFAQRHCFNLFSFLWLSALLAAVSDIICHTGSATRITQQKLAQYAADNIEPLWRAIPSNCTQYAEKYLGSADECVDVAPRHRYADGGAYLINLILRDPDINSCGTNIIKLFWKCSVAPAESIEFIKNVFKIAWKEQLSILSLAGVLTYLLYLKQKQYDRDITLSLSDKNNLKQLAEFEKNASGISFTVRDNQEVKMGQILFYLEMIKFSQNEIKKYQEYLHNRKACLESIFPPEVVKIIIDKYLPPPALSAPQYNDFNPGKWKKDYTAFFKSMMDGQEEAAATHDSKPSTSPAPSFS